ncbi:MAG: hypothetical protein AB2L18_06300 [Anaerolineaceae bacterium]
MGETKLTGLGNCAQCPLPTSPMLRIGEEKVNNGNPPYCSLRPGHGLLSGLTDSSLTLRMTVQKE